MPADESTGQQDGEGTKGRDVSNGAGQGALATESGTVVSGRSSTSEETSAEDRAAFASDMQRNNLVIRTEDEINTIVGAFAIEKVFKACKFPSENNWLHIDGDISFEMAFKFNVSPTSQAHQSRWDDLKKLINSKVCARRSSVTTAMRKKYQGELKGGAVDSQIFC